MFKIKIVMMIGFVEYVCVFEENMDDNMDFYVKIEGQYNMNFYFESDVEFEKFFVVGVFMLVMGYDIIKMGNSDLVMGKFVELKCFNKYLVGIVDFGGVFLVFDFCDGESIKKWDFVEDGELGNGFKVYVKVLIYGNGQCVFICFECIVVVD